MGDDAKVERAHVFVDDLKIAYEAAGTGFPPVVLIHGGFADRTYFDALARQVARRQRVVSLDLRGHGESDVPPEVSVEDFAADVIAVAAHAGIERAVLCGHSVGGAVALSVATTHPELVSGIVMLDSAVLFPEPLRRGALETLVPALGTDRWLDALRGYFGRILDPDDPPGLSARVMEALGRTRPELARSFFASLFASDYADAIEHVRCPLLYVHGKAPTDLQRLKQLRPDAMVGQTVGSGHYVMSSVPDQVNAMLERFLELRVLRG